jgi:iron complex transport system substrate-binding protein
VAPNRVVSVLPSATEIVCALGLQPTLVGRSAECDFPSSVRALPVVMVPRSWDSESSSGAIDARVSAARARGESLYTLRVDLLRELRPDVLLTQDLCGVCSVTGTEVEEACSQAGIHPTVVSLTPRTLDEVWTSVETVATALGDRPAGGELAQRLRQVARPTPSVPTARVAVLEWLDPPILSGLWTPSMVIAAGGTPVGTQPGRPGVRTTWSELRSAEPDLVVVSPCSFNLERTGRELTDPTIRQPLDGLSARYGTFVADEAYFSRPGPRLAQGVELLRHLLARESWDPPMPVCALDELEAAA